MLLNHDSRMEDHAPKGGWLHRSLRLQLAVLIILLECTVVLALASHVITVPVPPEPLHSSMAAAPPAPAPAPSDVRQKKSAEKQRTADAADYAAKTEPAPAPSDVRQKKSAEKQRAADAADYAAQTELFNSFTGIVEGVVQVTGGEDTSKEDDEADADSAQRTAEKQRAVDAADYAAKTEPFNPFAGIVEGVVSVEELPNDADMAASQTRYLNHDDAQNAIIGSTPYIEDWRVNLTIFSVWLPKQDLDEDEEADDVQKPNLIMQGSSDDSGTNGSETMSFEELMELLQTAGDHAQQ